MVKTRFSTPASSGLILSRRTALKGIGAVAAGSVLSAPWVARAATSDSVRVSNFGGFFEQAFAEHVYPAFTKKTGIRVDSIPQGAGGQFMVQLAQANAAGSAPMDVCCMGQADVYRGRQQGLWTNVDPSRLPNISNLMEQFVYTGDNGIDGVGAMGWYIIFAALNDSFDPLPTSWTELWGDHPNSFGLNSGSTSTLTDIIASVYFDGPDTLATEEGIDEIMAKLAELKPNTKLWWTSEGSMQTALQNDEIIGGQYYLDVTNIMKSEGTNITPVFPKEGGVLGFNAWCVPSSIEVTDPVAEFLNWSASAEANELIVKHVMATPLVKRDKLNLTDEEFASVNSDIDPIVVASENKVKNADYLAQAFIKTLSSGS